MLAAFIQERHDHIDPVSLACGSGNDPLQILIMVVRRHMVYMAADGVCLAVIRDIHHDKEVCAADGFFDVAFAFAGSETNAFTFNKERWFAVTLRYNAGLFLFHKFSTEFHKFLVYFLRQILTAGKSGDADRGDRKRFFK